MQISWRRNQSQSLTFPHIGWNKYVERDQRQMALLIVKEEETRNLSGRGPRCDEL